MSGKAVDLSGPWKGIFNYPALHPPTEFDAELSDQGGRIVGTTREPHYDGGAILHATIEGSHDASTIRFHKIYDAYDGEYDAVNYEGRIDASGDEISGQWTVPGVWSGTFLMVRAGRQEAEEVRAVEEEIES